MGREAPCIRSAESESGDDWGVLRSAVAWKSGRAPTHTRPLYVDSSGTFPTPFNFALM